MDLIHLESIATHLCLFGGTMSLKFLTFLGECRELCVDFVMLSTYIIDEELLNWTSLNRKLLRALFTVKMLWLIQKMYFCKVKAVGLLSKIVTNLFLILSKR